MHMILAIAFGGALGAVLRHLLNNGAMYLLGTSFPYGIFIANITGCFLMGVLVSVFAHFWDPGQIIKAFFTVGLLGAFTTFSAFSLDTLTLFERGDAFAAILYVALSVFLSLGGLFLGMLVVRVFV